MSGFTTTSVHTGPTTGVRVARFKNQAPIVTIDDGPDWWINISPSVISGDQASLFEDIAQSFSEAAAEIRRMHAAGIPAYGSGDAEVADDLDDDVTGEVVS